MPSRRCRQPDEPPRSRKTWTDDELQYLSDKYGLVTLKTLARNLQRTEGAVYLTTKKRLHGQRIYDNFYSAREVAKIIGVGCAKTIVFWRSKGWLKGRRSPYQQGINKVWVFKEVDVVKALRERPWLAKLDRMQEHLFRATVKSEWERDPWFTSIQASPFLGVRDINAVHRYIYLGWLPAVRKPGGPWQGTWIIRCSDINAFLANDPRPSHKSSLASQSRKANFRKEGRPVRLGTLWVLDCPSCGLPIKIMAPPKMWGTQVLQAFIQVYNNGACSHRSICRVERTRVSL